MIKTCELMLLTLALTACVGFQALPGGYFMDRPEVFSTESGAWRV